MSVAETEVIDGVTEVTRVTLSKEEYKMAVRTYFMLGAAEALLNVLKQSTEKPDFDQHFKTDGYFYPKHSNQSNQKDSNGTDSKSNT